MAWVAADYAGEYISTKKPFMDLFNIGYSIGYYRFHSNSERVKLPKGSIKKLIGRDLDWQDEPVELKEE